MSSFSFSAITSTQVADYPINQTDLLIALNEAEVNEGYLVSFQARNRAPGGADYSITKASVECIVDGHSPMLFLKSQCDEHIFLEEIKWLIVHKPDSSTILFGNPPEPKTTVRLVEVGSFGHWGDALRIATARGTLAAIFDPEIHGSKVEPETVASLEQGMVEITAELTKGKDFLALELLKGLQVAGIVRGHPDFLLGGTAISGSSEQQTLTVLDETGTGKPVLVRFDRLFIDPKQCINQSNLGDWVLCKDPVRQIEALPLTPGVVRPILRVLVSVCNGLMKEVSGTYRVSDPLTIGEGRIFLAFGDGKDPHSTAAIPISRVLGCKY